MKKTYLLLYLFYSIPLIGNAQVRDTLNIIEWNVENLFDCHHDTLKNDVEFLPDGSRHWTYSRYRRKLDHIAKTLVASTESFNHPALIALCEVENDSVLIALTQYSALKELNYRYIMTNSPDPRGIDVALLYQRDRFKLIHNESIPITPMKGFHPTRDILHATGLITPSDTLDIFVVHAPSRSGGEIASRPYRYHCIEILKKTIYSILSERPKARIIVTGDFNDFPESPSIYHLLNARAPEGKTDNNHLYHLMARRVRENGKGSYKYQGEWNLLDHFIVSGSLLNDNRIYTSETTAKIVCLPFLLTEDKSFGGMRPFRMFNGWRYENGFSDHLPIRMQIIIEADE